MVFMIEPLSSTTTATSAMLRFTGRSSEYMSAADANEHAISMR